MESQEMSTIGRYVAAALSLCGERLVVNIGYDEPEDDALDAQPPPGDSWLQPHEALMKIESGCKPYAGTLRCLHETSR